MNLFIAKKIIDTIRNGDMETMLIAIIQNALTSPHALYDYLSFTFGVQPAPPESSGDAYIRHRMEAFKDMLVTFRKFGQPLDKISAIKLYRSMFNLGLKDAKDAVEKMEYDLGEVAPNLFASRTIFPPRIQ